jgi:two-component sensor histidine kinase
MRECTHRAKNLISVVDAIAHQTATKNPEHFIERFSDRMKALSVNQDLLMRNEWKGAEIKSLFMPSSRISPILSVLALRIPI